MATFPSTAPDALAPAVGRADPGRRSLAVAGMACAIAALTIRVRAIVGES